MGSKIGRYRILQELSPGLIFLVKDNTNAKRLLKKYELASDLVLNDSDIKILRTLQHKNLLPPLDIFTKGEFAYVVYEYSNLDNLQNYLKRKGKLAQEEFSRILKQIIDGY